jgi:hypothetical protein
MDFEEYRRKAEHYALCARHMSDPLDKASLNNIATHWMELAKQLEHPRRGTERQIPSDEAPPLAPNE